MVFAPTDDSPGERSGHRIIIHEVLAKDVPTALSDIPCWTALKAWISHALLKRHT
jgi:hypothetical protein